MNNNQMNTVLLFIIAIFVIGRTFFSKGSKHFHLYGGLCWQEIMARTLLPISYSIVHDYLP